MQVKTWVILIIAVLFIADYFSDGFISDRITQLSTQALEAGVTDSATCAVGMYMVLPSMWKPSTDDLAFALIISLLIFKLIGKRYQLSLWKKAAIFGASWLAYKLIGMFLISLDPNCYAMYGTSQEFMSTPIGVIFSLIMLFFLVKWVISKYNN